MPSRLIKQPEKTAAGQVTLRPRSAGVRDPHSHVPRLSPLKARRTFFEKSLTAFLKVFGLV